MPYRLAGILLFIPCFAHSLTLDQKINLKLIESLWQDGHYSQAEEHIDKFLSKHQDSEYDDNLLKLKADLYIKKKMFKEAYNILNDLDDKSNFTKERKLLCLYELKSWNLFIEAFDKDSNLLELPFGKKIWDLGLAEAIQAEQNLTKKQLLIDKASHLYSSDLKQEFDQTKALSLAVIYEDKKEFQKAFSLYEKLFKETSDDAYQLSMAKMASHFDVNKSLALLEPLRWKSGLLGTSAALYAMQILDQIQNYHDLFVLSQEELKIAPEGYRKGKIALYHLKSLYYLKCFDRISDFYFAYNPHSILKNQDLNLAINLMAKTYLIKEEPEKLEQFCRKLETEGHPQALNTASRILAKHYLDHHDYLKAKPLLEDLLKNDVLHVDEYLTTLGFCYLNAQAFEVAEDYFIKVITTSPEPKIKQKALDHLLQLPSLSGPSLKILSSIYQDIDLKKSPNALYWIVESLKLENQTSKALELLKNNGDKKSAKYHQIMGELLEKLQPLDSISHFEEALKLTSDESLKAYLHGKLFTSYYEHNKDLAADHLFHSFTLHTFSIDKPLFDGLAAHLYQKAFKGIKIFLGDDSTKLAASQLIRLLSYKQQLNTTERILYGRTLRKLCRFNEAFEILKNAASPQEKLELARVYNQLGQYDECDGLIESVLIEKPYTLFLEGQNALMTKICLHYDRYKALTVSSASIDSIEKDLRVLQVCISDKNSGLAFECELIKQLFFSNSKQDLTPLRFHPFLDHPKGGCYRKILNFIINNRLDSQTCFTIEEPLSEPMEWLLLQLFGRQK
jgi:lipopolysaccharide biosynthesis regulator YciM